MSITALLLFTVLLGCADACTRRPPPPPPPPPDAPPAPPVPPPIVKVVRQQEQVVGFNKCYRKCNGNYIPLDAQGNKLELDYVPICTAVPPPPTQGLSPVSNAYTQVLEVDTPDNTGAGTSADQRGNPCGAESKCLYECKFKVYAEVALTTVSRPTGCGCAFHINMVNPRPSRVLSSSVQSSHVANEVTVGDFELVVWDYKANRVVETIPEFKLLKSEGTKNAIAQQVKQQNTADFTSVTAGYAAQVTSFPKLPASLDLNNPDNANHVPALGFEVTQIYTDEKVWDPPQQPQLEDMPNAYQSQCVPYWPETPFCYNSKKRMAAQDSTIDNDNANEACSSRKATIWHKKFLLFPKTGRIGDTTGQVYASRLITSFYKTDNCEVNDGMFSIDSEFVTELLASDTDTELALGTWAWNRNFVDGMGGSRFSTQYVLGVPGRFSSIKEVWDKGYSVITWQFPMGHNLLAEHASEIAKVCGAGNFNPTNAPASNDKYGESGLFYKPEAGIKCAPFDNVLNCPKDRSLMAFLNEGEILNFNKRPESTLIMGKMTSACNSEPYREVVFDTLTFTGCPPGRAPATRVRDRALHEDIPHFGLVYDEEAEGFVHFLHKRGHSALAPAHKRSLAEQLENQVATPPNEENYDMRFAAGSVDMENPGSGNDGDHPVALFPETFSAPVNIDPQANSGAIVEAQVTTGTNLPACHRGSIGCSCRVSGSLACDLGLECDSSDKCLPANCRPGQPGCVCANNQCEGANLECDVASNICKQKQTCTYGEPGCGCDLKSGCTGGAECTEGQCILGGACEAGSPGCACKLDDSCSTEGFACDALSLVCLAPRCTPGEPGCRCQNDGSCKVGFQCNAKVGVCSLFECPRGEPGCQCTESKACNKLGFKCVDYSVDGDARCVAEPDATCGNQHQRCIDECGVGNVRVCPQCESGVVYCRNAVDGGVNDPCKLDPNSPGCPGAASAMVLSVVAVMASLLAFF